MEQTYTVLTNEYLANGGDGYGVFAMMAKSKIPTGVSETDSLWFHAQSTCKVETNYKTKAQQEQQIIDSVPRMVYMVGKVNTGMNITTSESS
jgi:hypothetical protein